MPRREEIDYKRDEFEMRAYQAYFVSNVTKELELKGPLLDKAQLMARDDCGFGDDYEDKAISAMWFGWQMAIESAL